VPFIALTLLPPFLGFLRTLKLKRKFLFCNHKQVRDVVLSSSDDDAARAIDYRRAIAFGVLHGEPRVVVICLYTKNSYRIGFVLISILLLCTSPIEAQFLVLYFSHLCRHSATHSRVSGE